MSRCQCCLLGLCMHLPLQTTKTEDVRSLALPGSYSEKITHLGRSLLGFTRIKHLDLSRNAIESLEVTPCMLILLCLFKTHSAQLKKKTKACKFEVQLTYIWALYWSSYAYIYAVFMTKLILLCRGWITWNIWRHLTCILAPIYALTL